jgi:hypothetical protein
LFCKILNAASAVELRETVGDGVALGIVGIEGVTVGLGELIALGLGLGLGVTTVVGLFVTVGAAILIITPLLQMSFLDFFMHVYNNPL